MKFQALADASPNLIAITSPDGQKVYLNPMVVESGIEVSEEGVWITVAEYTGEQKATEIRRGLATAGHWAGDLSLSLAEGLSVAHVDAFALHHPDTGAELGTAWIGQDVSELRATEAALRAANARAHGPW